MEIFLVAIAWILGILSGLYFKISIVLFVIMIMFFYIIRKNNKYLKIICTKRFILIFAICYFVSYFQIIYLEKSYDTKYKNVQGEIQVVGTIISNPTDKEYKTSYTIKIESINKDRYYKNTNLLLNVKKDDKEVLYSYGTKISFVGEFEEPTLQRNTGGFNYKEFLKTKNIYGIVKTEINNIKVEKKNNINFIYRFANKVASSIENQANKLFDNKESSLLTGILIGNKENLEEDIKDAFRDSNLSHMLAVSGAHVSYVIIAITSLVTIVRVGKRNGKIIIILILLFFILMTGQTPSVTRACFMSIYILLSNIFHKKVLSLCSISISLVLLMIINPYYIFDIGFQLSYGGTMGIVFLYNPLKKYIIKNKIQDKNQNNNLNNNYNNKKAENTIKRYLNNLKVKIKEMSLITISANIIIFPIIMHHFNNLSLTFLVSNILASPIMGIIVILGFLTIIISFIFYPISKLFAILLKILLDLLLQIANFTSKLPFSKILVATPKLSFIVFYYIFIVLLFFYSKVSSKKKKRRIEKKLLEKLKNKFKKITIKKIIAIILILIILIFTYNQIPKKLQIYFIDVGQGDSTLIITPKQKTILIDGGGSEKKETFDVGEKTLIPYLLDKGITKLDYVLISHFDSDHVGGLLTLLEKMKVNKVIISKQGETSENYEQFKKIVRNKKIKVIVVKSKDQILIEKNINIQILWPKEEQIKENILNNNSIVAKLNYKKFSLLLTGDIEEIAEKWILEEYKNSNILKSTILKVAHHGSKSSSTQSFLDKVKPKIALIGVGEDNTFGHPNSGVLERLISLRYKNI